MSITKHTVNWLVALQIPKEMIGKFLLLFLVGIFGGILRRDGKRKGSVLTYVSKVHGDFVKGVKPGEEMYAVCRGAAFSLRCKLQPVCQLASTDCVIGPTYTQTAVTSYL